MGWRGGRRYGGEGGAELVYSRGVRMGMGVMAELEMKTVLNLVYQEHKSDR